MTDDAGVQTTEACECGANSWIPIVYGMPGVELAERARRGEVALGGCVIYDDMPERRCTECGAER